jgi:hypothetical protein
MTVGRGKDFERKETKAILKVLKNSKFKMDRHGRYQYKRWVNENDVKLAFGEDLLAYIKQMTYPYGDPINSCWSHLYKAGTGFMGLHQDKVPSNSMHMVDVGENYSDPFKLWSTSLLVTKSDDMEGGELVLAGDGYEDYDKLGSRLKIVNLKEKGQTASWNGETVHGVTEITKGTRWVFVTFKDVN